MSMSETVFDIGPVGLLVMAFPATGQIPRWSRRCKT